MKSPSPAPFYACLYPALADIARSHGYALAIHGSMQRDLDFIAVPWTDEVSAPEVLAEAIQNHLGALSFRQRIVADGIPEAAADGVVEEHGGPSPRPKPHGRLAWSLHLDFGSYVDLSIFPRCPQT